MYRVQNATSPVQKFSHVILFCLHNRVASFKIFEKPLFVSQVYIKFWVLADQTFPHRLCSKTKQ